jgi:hypothetical protein
MRLRPARKDGLMLMFLLIVELVVLGFFCLTGPLGFEDAKHRH